MLLDEQSTPEQIARAPTVPSRAALLVGAEIQSGLAAFPTSPLKRGTGRTRSPRGPSAMPKPELSLLFIHPQL